MAGVMGARYQDVVQTFTQGKSGGESSLATAAERDYRDFLTKFQYDVGEEERERSCSDKPPACPAPSSQIPLLAARPETVSRLEVWRELARTVLSLVLVVGEAVAWLELYSGLESSQHEVILYLLLAPTLVTSLAWLSTSCRWRVSWSTTCSLLGLLLLSLPSPVLLLLFHLYKTVKGRPLSSLLAFTQLARALSCSLPLLVYGRVCPVTCQATTLSPRCLHLGAGCLHTGPRLQRLPTDVVPGAEYVSPVPGQ